MISVKKCLIKTLFWFTSILCGIFILLAFFTFDIDHSILDASFHKELFIKNDIYTHSYNLIDHSLSKFIDSYKPADPAVYKQYKGLFTQFRHSVSKDMVQKNLDSIRDGLFAYFEGQKMYLPDIRLNFNQENFDEVKTTNTSVKALTSIDRINLGAILLYFNRNDITELFLAVKLVFYVLSQIPPLAVLFSLLCLIAGLSLCSSIGQFVRWLGTALLCSTLTSFAASIILHLYTLTRLPAIVSHAGTSLSFPVKVVYSYIDDCFLNLINFLLLFGVIALCLSLGLLFSSRLIAPLAKNSRLADSSSHMYLPLKIKSASAIILLVLLSSILTARVFILGKDFRSHDFYTVLCRVGNSSAATKVIAAQNDTIYAFQVKLVDSRSEKPVADAKIVVSGELVHPRAHYYSAAVTDNNGVARFTPGAGCYRLDFISSYFPTQYQMPSPIEFKLDKPGTTSLTVKLESNADSDEAQTGFVQIEVLDDNNQPIPGILLTVNGGVSASGDPDHVFSQTNSQGIAVFKLKKGDYQIAFVRERFPGQYKMQSPVNVTVLPEATVRYTMKVPSAK